MAKRLIFGAAALVLVCGAVVLVYQRWNQHPAPPLPQASAQPALEKVDLGEWSGGRKLWSLQADRVTYDNDRHNAALVGIRAQFWEGKTLVSQARSPFANVDTRDRRVEMGGGIAIDSKLEDASVRAARISWNGGDQRVHATGDVSFRRGNNLIRCRELSADRSLRRVTMQGPIAARFDLEIP
jgi:LPS export ABC transporter protein LptC